MISHESSNVKENCHLFNFHDEHMSFLLLTHFVKSRTVAGCVIFLCPVKYLVVLVERNHHMANQLY